MRARRTKRERWWLLPLLAVGLTALLNRFLFINARVPSGSMEPTIPSGALVLGNRLAYLREGPQVGDVVFFRHEEEFGQKILIKRVMAGCIWMISRWRRSSPPPFPETTSPTGWFRTAA